MRSTYIVASCLVAASALVGCTTPRSNAPVTGSALAAKSENPGVSNTAVVNKINALTVASNDEATKSAYLTGLTAYKPLLVVGDVEALKTFNTVSDNKVCAVLKVGDALAKNDRLFLIDASGSSDEARASVVYTFSKVAVGEATEYGRRPVPTSEEDTFSFSCTGLPGGELSFGQVSTILGGNVEFASAR